MGVSGCGKSTVGTLLANRLACPYLDADWLHPIANVAKMRAGLALGDEDRRPWLRDVAARIDAMRRAKSGGVVACSALKRAYRESILGGEPARLVYLKGDRETVGRRLAGRSGHYMPAALLESQYAALEEPGADERAIVVAIDAPPIQIVEAILTSR